MRSTAAPPTLLGRVVRQLSRIVGRTLFSVEVHGLDLLPHEDDGRPSGGWIAAGVPHRNWVEPFLLVGFLPARPRVTIVAEGRTVNRSWWRRLLVRQVGGVILIETRPGVSGFDKLARAVGAAVDAGAVVVIFPEAGSPSRPPELRRLSPGVAHLAARVQAPVVPIVFGGTHELYLRRRIVVRVLPRLAPPVTTARLDVAEFMEHLRGQSESAALEAHRRAESAAPRRKWWRWLSGNYPRA